MTRYKILDELLSDRYHCYTLDSLTEKVGERLVDMCLEPVSRRQLEKDLHYLEWESDFMVDLERYTATGEASFNHQLMKTVYRKGIRYKDPSFSIFQKKLSEDEKSLLRNLLSIVGQFEGLPDLATLEDLRQRLQLGEQNKCISLSHNPLKGTNTFGTLFSAISHQQVVELTYHTYKANSIRNTIVVSPYILKEYNRRWFLIAADKRDGKVMTFALDQIDAITPCPTENYVPYEGDIEERYENIIGVTLYVDNPIERILFWVNDESKNYVLSKPLHESQTGYTKERESAVRRQYPQLQGGAFFSIDCIVNYELIRELMSFGKNLLVLEPTHLREEIVEKLANNLQEYTTIK